MAEIPLTRGQFLIPFTEMLGAIGAPIGTLLEEYKLPVFLLGKEDFYMPMRNCIQFIEVAANKQGIADFGWHIAKIISLDHLNYASRLQIANSPTLLHGLRVLCARAQFENTNLFIWIESHGSTVRMCSCLKGTVGQHHLEHAQWLQNIVSVEIVRRFVGRRWTPETMAFEARYIPSFAVQEQWPNTRFLAGQKSSWIDIPVMHLGSPLMDEECDGATVHSPATDNADGLIQSLKQMLPAYLDGRVPTLRDVADMANTSTRSLQRLLADAGLGYRAILNMVRFERAVQLLKETDLTITEISMFMGYSSIAHFTRAFQGMTGVSPLRFRAFNRISEKGKGASRAQP